MQPRGAGGLRTPWATDSDDAFTRQPASQHCQSQHQPHYHTPAHPFLLTPGDHVVQQGELYGAWEGPGSSGGAGQRPRSGSSHHPAAPWVSRAVEDPSQGWGSPNQPSTTPGHGVNSSGSRSGVLLPGGVLCGASGQGGAAAARRPPSAASRTPPQPAAAGPDSSAGGVTGLQGGTPPFAADNPPRVRPSAGSARTSALGGVSGRTPGVVSAAAIPDKTRASSVPRRGVGANAGGVSGGVGRCVGENVTPSRRVEPVKAPANRKASPSSLLDNQDATPGAGPSRRPNVIPRSHSHSHSPSWSPPPWNDVSEGKPAKHEFRWDPGAKDQQGEDPSSTLNNHLPSGPLDTPQDTAQTSTFVHGTGRCSPSGFEDAASLPVVDFGAPSPPWQGKGRSGGTGAVEAVVGSRSHQTQPLPGGAFGSGAIMSGVGEGGRRGSGNLAAPSQNRSRHAAASDRVVSSADAQDLKREVEHLRQLLGVVTAGETASTALPDAQVPSALTRARAQCWQLQRQVALMGAELKAHTQMTALAQSCLLELHSKLDDLVRSATGGGVGGITGELTIGQLKTVGQWAASLKQRIASERAQLSRQLSRQGLQQQQDNKDDDSFITAAAAPCWQVPFIPVGGNRHLAASMAAAAQAAAARGPGNAAGGVSWSSPAPAAVCGGGGRGSGTAGSMAGAAAAAPADDDSAWAEAAEAAAAAVAAQCTFARIAQGAAAQLVKAPATAATVVAAPSAGAAVAGLDPASAHHLEAQLADLAPRLSSVAVLLKTSVLPVLPWLATEATDRLQVEMAETAHAVSSAAHELSMITSLLPGGAAVISGAEVAGDLARRGLQVSAGRDAWMYGDEQQLEEGAGSDPMIMYTSTCGLDVSGLVGALTPLMSTVKDRKGAAGGGSVKQLRAMVDRFLVVPLQVGSAKQALLQQELAFCCRVNALQAQHVRHMFSGGAGVSHPSRHGHYQRHDEVVPAGVMAQATKEAPRHVQGLQQLMAVMDELNRQPNEELLAQLVTELHDCRPSLEASVHALQMMTKPSSSPSLGGGLAQQAAGANEVTHVQGYGSLEGAMAALDVQRQQARAAATGAHAGQQHKDAITMPWDYENENPGGVRATGGSQQQAQKKLQKPARPDWLE